MFVLVFVFKYNILSRHGLAAALLSSLDVLHFPSELFLDQGVRPTFGVQAIHRIAVRCLLWREFRFRAHLAHARVFAHALNDSLIK